MPAFLVAEDDPRVGRILARKLSEHGVTRVVRTCGEARDAFAQGQYNAVVADVGLPDGSGIELVTEIHGKHPELPLLIVSGEVDASRLAGAHAIGAHFLLKPIQNDQLELFASRVSVSQRTALADRIERILLVWGAEHQLTLAETELLRLVALGTPRSELAELRGVLPSTVKKQVAFLLLKTGDATIDAAANRLLRAALSQG